VRQVALLATNHIPAICRQFGRCEKTVGLMRALLQPMPPLWVALAEQEENDANLEHDLLLQDQIEELELEEESCHLATELCASFVPLTGDKEDDEKAKTWTLPSVPAALKTELESYTVFRTEPLQRQRLGSCVVDTTVGSDKATYASHPIKTRCCGVEPRI
jgi:hypothetical protein